MWLSHMSAAFVMDYVYNMLMRAELQGMLLDQDKPEVPHLLETTCTPVLKHASSHRNACIQSHTLKK